MVFPPLPSRRPSRRGFSEDPRVVCEEMSALLTQSSTPLRVKSVGDSFAEKAPTSKEHLALYCALVLGVRIPHPAHCENHQSPLDALWDAYTDEYNFGIWHAMRGSGKTLLLAVLAFIESVFKPNCGTTVLGGSLEQSQRCVGYLNSFWQRPEVPRRLLLGEVSARGYKLSNGSWVTALAASQKSVRGPHPQRLRLDEVDEMAPEIFNAALGQPMSKMGIPDQIVASSTLHHPFGMMAELIDKREERGAVLYRWCVEEVRAPAGFWTDEEIERKRRQVTEAMWDSEYCLKRPTIGETIYDFESVERAYARGKDATFIPKLKTEAGIDWGHTCTVMHIIQDAKDKFIAPESHRWEFIELTERCQQIADLCLEKGISTIYCDSAPKDSNITLLKILRKNRVGTKVQPVAFSKWKSRGIDVMRFLFEKNMIDIADKTAKEKLQKYHYKNAEADQVAKEDDHDPDAFTAWASSKSYLLVK